MRKEFETMKTLKHFLAACVILMLLNDIIQVVLTYRSYRKRLNKLAAARLIKMMKKRMKDQK